MNLLSLLGVGEISLSSLIQDFLYSMFLWVYNLIDENLFDLPLF